MSQTPGSFERLRGVSSNTAAQLARDGITSPFPIQEKFIPIAVRGRDVLAQAPTGSGKTLAFGIPIVEQLPANTRRPAALILVPTRELCLQVATELESLCDARGLRIAPVFGGTPLRSQATRASKAAVVVATPGRLDDLLNQRLIDLRNVEILVLDEADRMLDMGFAPQVDGIVERLPRDRQTMLLSATLDGATARMVSRYTHDAETVRVERERSNADIEHVFEPTTNPQRVMTLLDVLDDDRDCAVVFVRTKRGADRLNKKLRNAGLDSTALHGGMTQSARLRELKKFREGQRDVLVATDVFARGIDMDRITLVVNYDPPEDSDTYMHRIGRTGRAGRSGIAISLVAPDQEQHMQTIAREIGMVADAEERPAPAPKQQRGEQPAPRQQPARPSTQTKPQVAVAESGASTGDSVLAGTLKFFNRARGYGFITPDCGGDELFVHHRNVGAAHRALTDGARVSFAVATGAKGPEAVRVSVA